jgi:hypothetical protein
MMTLVANGAVLPTATTELVACLERLSDSVAPMKSSQAAQSMGPHQICLIKHT